MATNVLMPQLGESIAEGTIVRWNKRVGEHVDRDEPLFEVSTDKVDAEVPSPAGGVLAEVRVQAGETVPVDSVVATIAGPGRSGRRVRRLAVSRKNRRGAGSRPGVRGPGGTASIGVMSRRWSADWPASTASIRPRWQGRARADGLRRTTS